MAETRKIAAILAADVVGFSRMASADEDRTLAWLRILRSEVIDPTIASYFPAQNSLFSAGARQGAKSQARQAGLGGLESDFG